MAAFGGATGQNVLIESFLFLSAKRRRLVRSISHLSISCRYNIAGVWRKLATLAHATSYIGRMNEVFNLATFYLDQPIPGSGLNVPRRRSQRMTSQLVLVVDDEPQSPGRIFRALAYLPPSKGIWIGMADDAIGLVEQEKPSLVVTMLGRGHGPARYLDLIARCVAKQTSVPIIVLSDTYDEAEATALFRMGVTDYLSQADHADQILPIVDTLLRPGPRQGLRPNTMWAAGRTKRPRIRNVSPGRWAVPRGGEGASSLGGIRPYPLSSAHLN
jgi:ActR/RegA family two-component response regulator